MGIVHRDVKPQNIMLDSRNEPQLMDFGLAKRVNEDSTMTTEGSLLGTLLNLKICVLANYKPLVEEHWQSQWHTSIGYTERLLRCLLSDLRMRELRRNRTWYPAPCSVCKYSQRKIFFVVMSQANRG